MESTHQTPSVILKVMGLNKVPPQQHYNQDKPKVLSDEYFQKVASIGVRKKRSSCQHHSDGMSTDEKEECKGVLKVVKTIRRDEHHNPSKGNGEENPYLSETKVKDLPHQLMDVSYKSVHMKPEALVDAVSAFNHETFRFSKSQLDLKDETFNSRIAGLKANPGKGRNGLNYASLPSSCKNSRLASGMLQEVFYPESLRVYPEIRSGKKVSRVKDFGEQSSKSYSQSSEEVSIPNGNAANRVSDTVSSSFSRGNVAFAQRSDMLNPASNVEVNKIQANSLFFCSGGAYLGSEPKNKTLEQRDVPKKLQAVERQDLGSTHHQLLTISEHRYYGARNMNNQSRFSNDNIKMNTIRQVGVKYSRPRKLAVARPLRASSVITGNHSSMDKDNFFAKYWGLRKNASANWIIQKFKNQSVNQKDCSEDLRSNSEKLSSSSSHFINNHIEEGSIGQQKLKSDNDLSDKKPMLPQLSISGPSPTFVDNQILQETCLINDEVKKNKPVDSTMHILSPNSSVNCSKSDAKGEVVSRSHNNATMQQSESTAFAWSRGDSDSLSHSSYASTQRDASELQEDSACSLFSGTEPDSLGSFGDAYGPSPVSVLNPSFREDISSSLKVVGADEYDSSEAEDEEFGLNVSSDDEDCEDESVAGYEETKDLVGSFRSEESRDFSYVVEVLSEADIFNRSLFTDFSTWHSPECPISPSVFEVLEKKFGEQQFWKRSERRLLFDRINVGLSDILQPCSYIPTWEKPVSRRLNAELRQDMIEEEMWELLVAQEKKLGKDSADNMLGGEVSWIELGENIEDIVRDMVNFLIEELANEIVSFENFWEV